MFSQEALDSAETELSKGRLDVDRLREQLAEAEAEADKQRSLVVMTGWEYLSGFSSFDCFLCTDLCDASSFWLDTLC